MRDEKTGYLQTFPFEENNPMPEAFERTSEYLVKLLDPVIKPKNSEGGGKEARPRVNHHRLRILITTREIKNRRRRKKK
jgi:hypothetical protein